jgi:hypothetical protein
MAEKKERKERKEGKKGKKERKRGQITVYDIQDPAS